SPTMRAILMSRLAAAPDISVVATAGCAAEGRALIREFDPDVITLDIEMPGISGLEFLEKIMRLRPTPVIIVSGATRNGNETTARALSLGAVDCYAKPNRAGNFGIDDDGKLANLIRQAAQLRHNKNWPASSNRTNTVIRPLVGNAKAIAIGSSTGGIEALRILLRDFPEDCPPTLVVQHVNARFAPAIARTLDEVSPARVVLAEPDMPVRRGHVYLAPGDRHMMLHGSDNCFIKLRHGPPVSGHVPSVDVLFRSVARTCGAQAVGVLLTGMGSDGAKGLLAMAAVGAQTIVQDQASCIVFGMPKAAISLGAANVVAPLEHIAQHAFAQTGRHNAA
ncbi:MAG: chemotaxis-specific protein-glutamate methyltransferase CheB, partial [Novosphingobium sp.]